MSGEDSTLQAPFPYFGGKRRAAQIIWSELGDPGGYVEPFAGSAAVLLARPEFNGRRVETINDTDGWLVNTWRAIQLSPDEVARHCAGPVTEIDYHARLAWLQERRGPELISWLEGDPEHCDAKAAGWWLYVAACGIGDPWGQGPWRVIDGHLRDTRTLPHFGDAGQGVCRQLPHLGDAGQGVNRALPHLGPARGVARGVDTSTSAIAQYMHDLSARLSRVRITCGDWSRVTKPAVIHTGTGGDGARALLLDPPYATGSDVYGGQQTDVADAVRQWCLSAPGDLRIVLAGYDHEHDELLRRGWHVVQGKSGRGCGYSTRLDNGRRERLWCSPSCLGQPQNSLFDEEIA